MTPGTRAPLYFAVLLGAIAVLWLLYPFVAPDTPQTTLRPATEFARSTHGPYAFIFWLTAVVFVAVEAGLVYALFRFRRRTDELPSQTHGNTALELSWTLATTALVIVMFIPSCQQVRYAQSKPPTDALRIEVTGHQWWWDAYYPEEDVITANEIHVPVGRTVALDLTSADVIHSFWIPRLGGKRDMVPGRRQILWFTPESPGVYEGQCAEYCGTSHTFMAMQIVAETPEGFRAWIEQQKAASPPSTDPKAQLGQVAFLTTAGCVICHSPLQNDRLVRGMLGPNLRKLGTRQNLGAGMFGNTPEALFRWIKDPQSVKPGAKMDIPVAECTGPGTPKPCCRRAGIGNCLSDETVEQLVAYLQSLK